MNKKEYEQFAAQIRIAALKALRELGAGHVGGSMSMADLMAVLYGGVMKVDPKNPRMEDRDWLVISKGHCGPALYATLAVKGFFDESVLPTLNQPKTILPSHCDRNLTPGVDMTTGSLGQGMSTALGAAWGNRYKGLSNYTFLVLGDGESQEGQVWEGAIWAAQQKLSHLIAFVDYNKKQLDGYVDDIGSLGDLRQKFEDFGWDAQEVDGQDHMAIYDAIQKAKECKEEKPHMIVLHTKKGVGCSFAENVFYNHHMTFTKDMVDEAIAELEKIAQA